MVVVSAREAAQDEGQISQRPRGREEVNLPFSVASAGEDAWETGFELAAGDAVDPAAPKCECGRLRSR
jgi:hypothetical protein